MKHFRKRTVIYITITAILLSLFSVSSLTLAAFATDGGESSDVSQPVYSPAPALPIEMVVPSDALYMNYPDVAAALECLPVEPLPDTVTLFQYFDRLWVVEWLEAEIDYAEMPANEAAELMDTYVTSFYTRAKELGLDKYVPDDQIATFGATDLRNGLTKACWDGTGSVKDPYLIKTQYDLEYMAYVSRSAPIYNCYFQLANDIALVGYNDSNSWVPIGGYAAIANGNFTSNANLDYVFRSQFDGNNKTISGLYINQTTYVEGANMTWYVGLFGAIGAGAVIKDLTVSGTVTGLEYVGGIVGYADGAKPTSGKQGFTISNCTANVTVNGNFYVGGIVGRADNGTIANCETTGSVVRPTTMTDTQPTNLWNYDVTLPRQNGDSTYTYGCFGGIAGIGTKLNINGCINGAVVRTNQTNNASYFAYVGGVLGFAVENTLVTNSQNKVNVAGVTYVGGIVGTAIGNSTDKPQIINCVSYNNNLVQASGGIGGGILAHGNMAIVRGCQNKSTVTGTYYMGGIVGQMLSSEGKGAVVEDCINGGTVQATENFIGGIVGHTERSSGTTNEAVYINYCRNYGLVNGEQSDGTSGAMRVGGIVGLGVCTSVEACTNGGIVRGGSRVGGIFGEMRYGEMILCHNNTDAKLQIMGSATGQGANETYEAEPLGGGFIGCLEVNGSTRLQASLNQGGITGYRNGGETGQASNWDNVASRVGWASAPGHTYICYRQTSGAYTGSCITSEVSQLYNFFLLIDADLSPSGKAYGTAGENHAIELFPVHQYHNIVPGGIVGGEHYISALKKGTAIRAFSINASDGGISKVTGKIRMPSYGPQGGSILGQGATDYTAHTALYYWIATGNKVDQTPLTSDLTNRMRVQFCEGLYLTPTLSNNSITAKVTYSSGTNAPASGITMPTTPFSETKTLSGRSPADERALALTLNSATINAATDLGDVTIGSISGLDEYNSIVYNNYRYYFLGYTDAGGKWYQPGDTISYSLWGDRADYTLTLTAQWVSGYSVRYAVADSLVTDGGAAFSFILPIDQTLYTDDSALITVMAPERYETFLGRFSYWSLNQQGTGTRYYPDETYTLSQLGVSNGEVVFYFAQPVWDLTVNTQMNGPYVEGSFIEGQTDFVYTLENDSIGFRLQFIVPAQQSVTITEIPANVGNYTLTQHSGWAWKYQSKKGIIQYNDNGTWVDWESDFGPFTNYVTFAPYNGKDINVTFINAYYNGVYNTNLKGGVA